MLASELEDRLGEGVVHANMATTQEMLTNMEEALIHQEKVCRESLTVCPNLTLNILGIQLL